ncbi:MAG: trigger factor [Chloroflexi bacterium]|nr:MAG: trigger factor [Chloroflexota bacterium]
MVTVSTRPEPGSRVALDIEVPPPEVDRHFATAYTHLAQRTRVPGFRPGKAPRHLIDRYAGRASVVAEAIDHLVSASYDAALDQTDLIPIDQPDVQIDAGEVAEGTPVRFTATVSVRPEVTLGDYADYAFELEHKPVTDDDVEAVLTEMREGQATLRPIDGRAAQNGDVAAVKFTGTIDGEPFEGGSADRLPLVIGEGRMIAGWEEQLVGMQIGERKAFDVTFPDDYRVEDLRGKQAHFEVELLDLRERVLPELDDEFARSAGEVETLDALRAEIHDALDKRNQAEARHVFGDRIIEYATANATVDLPEVMIANEVDIMRDELRARLAQQRIGLDQYLALAKQSPEELLAELREPASRRVKTLLVLSAIAEREGIDAIDAEIDAEAADQLSRYGDEPKLREYLGSRRGRSYLRMTLRNQKLVEHLVNRKLGTDTPSGTGEEPPSEAETASLSPASSRSE